MDSLVCDLVYSHSLNLTHVITQDIELKYGADQVLALIMPVSLCMIAVVATIRSVTFYSTNDTQFVYVCCAVLCCAVPWCVETSHFFFMNQSIKR